MGNLRTALHAYILDGQPPAAAVERLDALMFDLEEPSMATLVYLTLDPVTRRVEYVRAGHPPPLLRDPRGQVHDLNDGHDAYMIYCYACHGEKGDGRGPSSSGLRPPPRDFTRASFKFARVQSLSDICQTVLHAARFERENDVQDLDGRGFGHVCIACKSSGLFRHALPGGRSSRDSNISGSQGAVQKSSHDASTLEVTPESGENFYYAKIIEDEGATLWSAPVWITAP